MSEFEDRLAKVIEMRRARIRKNLPDKKKELPKES